MVQVESARSKEKNSWYRRKPTKHHEQGGTHKPQDLRESHEPRIAEQIT
jgi:hypothetical protein